jgi:hypothetical protein
MKWLLIVLVAACGGNNEQAKKKTPEELKSAWGAKVKAKLDKVVAAAKVASGGDLGTPGDAKLALDFEWEDATAHPNAIAVQIDDVQSATEPRAVQKDPNADAWKNAEEGKPIVVTLDSEKHARFTFQTDYKSHVFKAKALLSVPKAGDEYPEYVYDQFVNAKYLLVVTPGDVQWAVAEGSTFQPGAAPMRAVLVDIETAKPLGGFEATAHNSKEIKVTETKSGMNTKDKLDDDLRGASGKAIVEGINQRWPGSKTPILSWGF